MKLQPSVRTLTITIPNLVPEAGETTVTKYIDISQCASLVNRRFYRQGLNWAVSGFTLHLTTDAIAGSIQIMKLPNTWVASNAWEKSMRAWLKQQNDAIEEAGAESAVARFRDFKIHADKRHVENGFANNLLPATRDNAGVWQSYSLGEWQPSFIVIPNADGASVADHESMLHMTGDNFVGGTGNPQDADSRGMIEGYADSRAFPQSPDPVSPSIYSKNNWMRDMFDVGNDSNTITQNATDNNDNLPYNQVNYPNGENNANDLQYHDQLNALASTISGKVTGRGGNFPCGIVKLQIDQTLGAISDVPVAWLQVHLVPGMAKGYLTEPMTDM